MYIILNDKEEIFSGYSPNGRLMWEKFSIENTDIRIAIYGSESEACSCGNYIQEQYSTHVSVIPLRQWLDTVEGK